MTSISVGASRSYEVLISRGLLSRAGEMIAALKKPCRVAVVSDSNVHPLYDAVVAESLRKAGFDAFSLVFPAGERSKNLGTFGKLLESFAEHHLSRSDLVVALGGGVTGDLAGFAAAAYLRGIDYVQIPTTLLAMVDSSVGGKTAVDLEAGKNLAGAFYQPILVLCDPNTLQTLPESDFCDGCAEVIKYGLLGNADFFTDLEKKPIREQLEHVLEVCVSMKRDLVQEDERDTGVRRLLNLGHSFGHGVEKLSDYRISHGQAVAVGMAIITRAAVAKGVAEASTLDRLLALLEKTGLPTETTFAAKDLAEAAKGDKKISGGKLHLIVPEAVGRCRVVPTDPEELNDWLHAGGVE